MRGLLLGELQLQANECAEVAARMSKKFGHTGRWDGFIADQVAAASLFSRAAGSLSEALDILQEMARLPSDDESIDDWAAEREKTIDRLRVFLREHGRCTE